MPQGKFKGWSKSGGYGFISSSEMSADVFLPRSAVEDPASLRAGAVVSFNVVETDRGYQAQDVVLDEESSEISLDPAYPNTRTGHVKFWEPDKGFGFIVPEDGGEDVFISPASLRSSGVSHLQTNDIVRFKTYRTKGGKGECGNLERISFSALGNVFDDDVDGLTTSVFRELANTAENEVWHFSSARSRGYPILRSYIKHTFLRLFEMDDGIALSESEELMCFNTGLVTDNQEALFLVFRENPDRAFRRWVFSGIHKESSRFFVENFGSKNPPLAEYFTDPSDLLFDRRLNLVIDFDHVMENISRFPEHLRENQYMARQLLVSAQAQTEKRVYRNYKTAIPQFFRDKKAVGGKIQLLLPICLEAPNRADLALTVAKNSAGDAYLSSTVLTLDMAYCNARLLARPDREWLEP